MVFFMFSPLLIVSLRHFELDGGENGDDEGQNHADGTGIAQVVEPVRGVVDLVHDGHGGVQRAALGQQLNQREALEGVDGGDDQHHTG